ncbi:MAG: hypothetical protein P4L50_03295 [Anaerolineaceae bacterium]|nr:hypothetical protein [Anaerolineaceae bacterium]
MPIDANALDIREGDILSVDGREYPIKSAAEWAMSRSTNAGFRRLATKSAMTKRAPVITSGKRGPAEIHLANIICTPLDPVDAQVRQRLGLDTPNELLQTFVASACGFIHLILEDLKR